MHMRPTTSKQLRFKAKVFRALSDPRRLAILEFLRDGEKCVCEIVPHLALIQPVVSRHLKILKDCGLLHCRREGNRRLYSITDARILGVVDTVDIDIVNALSKRIIAQIT
jgi:DNA-binding transcriptional ArsR family regulator